MSMSQLKFEHLDDAIDATAVLHRKGIVFQLYQNAEGEWIIDLTGVYLDVQSTIQVLLLGRNSNEGWCLSWKMR